MRFSAVIFVACILIQAPIHAMASGKQDHRKKTAPFVAAPQVIPHWVSDAASGDDCLKCHASGKGDAPATPHPERINCTQCHVRDGKQVR